jgi:thymidylate synthase
MRTITAPNGASAVKQVCDLVLSPAASEAEPRGQKTREVLGVSIELPHPHDVMPTGIGRQKLLPAIGVAEGLQNISGLPCPGLMARISKFFAAPTSRWDAGIPTYAERLQTNDQLASVVRKLEGDRDSRQAVATVWQAYDLELGQAHNLCTLSLHFLIRRAENHLDWSQAPDDALHMFVTMRSNDAWYGLCYDLHQFAMVQLAVANALGVRPGPYVHTAHSMHLYERHFDVARQLAGERAMGYLEAPPHDEGVGRPGMGWYEVRDRARTILFGDLPRDPTPSEEWYADALEPFAPAGD